MELPEFLASLASARLEAQMLFELTQELGNSLSLYETLSVLSARLNHMVPYDAIAIFVRKGDRLVPEYVTGKNFRLLSSLEIPVGEGLSGWVLENRRAMLNGNPSVESGYLNDPTKSSILGSALAVPLEGVEGLFGTLTLYRLQRDAFTQDDLRILQTVSTKASLAIENAIRFQHAENAATTDPLTGLPNARSLFLHLDAEMARARRSDDSLTVLVCDLDNFKTVNEGFGQRVGDRVLVEVAKGLKQSCREYDYVARMGGDEFVLVLPGMTTEGFAGTMDRIAGAVSDACRFVCGIDQMTISMGKAMFPADGAETEQLLAVADRKMCRLKKIPPEARLQPALEHLPEFQPLARDAAHVV